MNPVSFANPIRPQQKGYIYIWVSNESENTKVWFDDLKVTHRSRRVTQATDYYAYGSVLREQKTPEELTYRYKYQGQYAEKDEETGWSHFELREFDPVIGRWTITDPKREFESSYLGMGNDPINKTDKDGGCTTCPPPGNGLTNLLFAMRSGQKSVGSLYYEGSAGFGFGTRMKSGVVGGTGFNIGGDGAHWLLYFGNRRIGLQTSLGVLGASGDYKGKYYSEGEYYFSRGFLEYDFKKGVNGDINFNQYKYDISSPIMNQTELLFDKTPANNIDAIGPKIGFETNFFDWIVDSVKSFVNDRVQGLTVKNKIESNRND